MHPCIRKGIHKRPKLTYKVKVALKEKKNGFLKGSLVRAIVPSNDTQPLIPSAKTSCFNARWSSPPHMQYLDILRGFPMVKALTTLSTKTKCTVDVWMHLKNLTN